MKHLYYPCTARLYTVLCIYKLWSVHYILYIWRHFVKIKPLWERHDSCFNNNIVTSSLTLNIAVLYYFLRLCFMLNRLLLVSISLKFCDHVETICSWVLLGTAWVTSNKRVMGERDQGTLGRFPQNKPVSLIVTTPLLLHIVQHCLRQGCENEYNYMIVVHKPHNPWSDLYIVRKLIVCR